MPTQREYYQPLAAAYIRGKLHAIASGEYPELFEPELEALSDDELARLVKLAQMHELRLHRFKCFIALPTSRLCTQVALSV